jgi:hypothetical protein
MPERTRSAMIERSNSAIRPSFETAPFRPVSSCRGLAGAETGQSAAREAWPGRQLSLEAAARFGKATASTKATGDRYAGDVIADMFCKRSPPYDPTDYNKSDLHHDLLPLLNIRAIVLPRHDRLITQIVGVERRVGSSGRASISHLPGGHDDVANVVAGVAKLVHQKRVFVRPRSTRLDWL